MIDEVEVDNDEDVTDSRVEDVDDRTVDVVEVEEVTCAWARKFNVIVPGPTNVATIGLFEPEQYNPPEQLQFKTV